MGELVRRQDRNISEELTRWIDAHGTTSLERALAVLTGAVSTEKKELFATPGKILQAVINRSGIAQLMEELRALEEKGRIRKDYLKSKQAQSCFHQLFPAMDEGPLEQEVFDAMKAVLIAACTEDISKRDDVEPGMLMEVLKSMGSGELIILADCFNRMSGDDQLPPLMYHKDWIGKIGDALGIPVWLVRVHEDKLIEKRLIMPRDLAAEIPAVHSGGMGRLTDLGYRICTFLEHYRTTLAAEDSCLDEST